MVPTLWTITSDCGLFCAVNKGLSVEKLSNKGNVGAHRICISLWFAELTSRNVTT